MNSTNPVATYANILAYNPGMQVELRAQYNEYVQDTVTEILFDSKMKDVLKKADFRARLDGIKLHKTVKLDTFPETAVSEADYKKAIKDYDEVTRAQLWEYRRMAIRIAALATLQHPDNRRKLSYRVNGVMHAFLDAMLKSGTNQITLSQVAHAAVRYTRSDFYVTKEGEKRESTAWINDEIAITLISEMAEEDYFDLKLWSKTHVLSMTARTEAKVDAEGFKYMSQVARFLNMQTVLTEPATIGKDITSKSSWWYKTPKMSDDQREFMEIMYGIQFGFVENAEELIEKAYREHLKIGKPDARGRTIKWEKWNYVRLAEYKAQIRASKANGCHYVAGKQDSANRYYFGAEIGHFQTSSALRSLTIAKAIQTPVKYDFRNNVVQMYALLTGIKNLGKFVGLVDASEEHDDLRQLIAEDMNKSLKVTTFTKDNIKPLFMIWAYSAGRKRLCNGETMSETNMFTGHTIIAQKTEGLLSLSGLADEDLVWEAWESIVETRVPGIVALKIMFKKLLKGNPLTEVEWTLPDGTIAQYASVETISKSLTWVTSTYKMHTHTHYRKEIVEGAKNTGLLPRIIHSFDAYVMRQLIIRAHKLGITLIPNHDSFIFDECHQDVVFGLVADIYVELRGDDEPGTNALEQIITELNVEHADLTVLNDLNKPVTFPDFGERLSEDDIRSGKSMAAEDM